MSPSWAFSLGGLYGAGKMKPSEAEVVDRLFNAAWREGFAADRRMGHGVAGGAAWASVRFPGGSEFVAAVQGAGQLDWLKTRPPYYVRFPGQDVEVVESAAQAVEVFDDGGPGFDRLRDEVASSAENLEAALAVGAERTGPVRASGLGLVAYAHSGADLGGVRPEEWLESWVLRGHPFHPGCKTRSGFSRADLARYSPELAAEVALRFVAVRREFSVETRASGYVVDWPTAWGESAARELHAMGLVPGAFTLFPVHPWQFDHQLPEVFAADYEGRCVIPLDFSVPVRPLTSLRTLVVPHRPWACHLKVPVAIQTTSAQRTVSAASAENGPAFTAWIERARSTLAWAGDWELQREDRGLHWWNPASDPTDPAALEKARHLSVLCRRPPSEAPGTWTVPSAVLAEPSPVDGLPVVAELARLCPRGPGGFLRAYAALTLRAVLPLALCEGIALEAHAQNVLVRFRGSLPVSAVLRDLGGLRVFEGWASPAAAGARLHPATLIKAASPAELAGKIHHTWLNNHMAPLVRAVAEGFSLDEPALWAGVRDSARSVFAALRGRVPDGRLSAFEPLFFAPTVRVKALTRMRLTGKYFQYDLAEVPNPLHEA